MWTGAKGNEWFHGGGGEWTAGGARVDDPGDVQDHNKRPDARLLGRNLQYFLPKVRHQPPGVDEAPLRSVRMVARNSGLFYLSATHEALRLMEVLAARMASEDVWDQSAYNMEIFRPSYGNCTRTQRRFYPRRLTVALPLTGPACSGPRAWADEGTGVSVRSMNYLCFCNTKLLFKFMRHDAELIDTAQHVPVTVHSTHARRLQPPD